MILKYFETVKFPIVSHRFWALNPYDHWNFTLNQNFNPSSQHIPSLDYHGLTHGLVEGQSSGLTCQAHGIPLAGGRFRGR